MCGVRSKALSCREIILSAVLFMLVFVAVASALTVDQSITAVAGSNSGCLLGAYTVERSATAVDPVSGTQHEVLVRVLMNVTQVKEGEFLVKAVVFLIPKGGGKVTVMYTPPLTDMVVYTDVGTFRWSQGKYFIQAIVGKDLPITSQIEMRVKGNCVKGVVVEVRPLKTELTFGSSYSTEVPSQTTSVRGKNAGYLIMVGKNGSLLVYPFRKPVAGMASEEYVVRNVTLPCRITIGGILINEITVKVYVPKNLSNTELKKALQPLTAICSENTGQLKGVVVVISNGTLLEVLRNFIQPRFTHVSSAASTVTSTETTTLTVPTMRTTVTVTNTHPQTTSTTSAYSSVPTTPLQAVHTTAAGQLSSTPSSTPLPLTTSSRALATVVALGIAFIAGIIAYLLVIRRA